VGRDAATVKEVRVYACSTPDPTARLGPILSQTDRGLPRLKEARNRLVDTGFRRPGIPLQRWEEEGRGRMNMVLSARRRRSFLGRCREPAFGTRCSLLVDHRTPGPRFCRIGLQRWRVALASKGIHPGKNNLSMTGPQAADCILSSAPRICRRAAVRTQTQREGLPPRATHGCIQL
jgi:hypothetical protein